MYLSFATHSFCFFFSGQRLRYSESRCPQCSFCRHCPRTPMHDGRKSSSVAPSDGSSSSSSSSSSCESVCDCCCRWRGSSQDTLLWIPGEIVKRHIYFGKQKR